jgi:CheY-like chemotaxis protein
VKTGIDFDIPFAHVRNLIGTERATRLLLVDPDPVMRAALTAAVGRSARVDACSTFQSARARLNSTAYDLLVTAARLREFNGLHLVYLSKHAHEPTHAIVYDERLDSGFAAEARRACAFFELAHKMAVALPAYIGASLPGVDRRTPTVPDRRLRPRGGRRRWDRHAVGRPSLGEQSESTSADG